MASRRTTLGPVSNSALNSRVSVGWGSGGAKGAFQSSALKSRRASAAPALLSNSKRRSSAMSAGSIRRNSALGSRSGGSYQQPDPRPLSDKSFMASSVRNLICYLSEHGFDHAISPKLLSNPTSKDFQHILLFLLRQIDPSYSFQNRLEDDVRAIFKQLGYPFAISKSALHAVGSPHTWPALLGALSWLLELLTYNEAAVAKEDGKDNIDAEAESNRLFFDYLQNTYESFLAGDDNFEEFDEELAESFETKNRQVQDEIEQLEAENEELKSAVERIRTTESPLVSLTNRKTDLEANVAKFKKLIDELEQYKKKTEARVSEKGNEAHSREQELRELYSEHEQLKTVVAQQENDAVDVQRIERDRSSLRAATERIAEQRAHAEDMHKAADNAVVAATQAVEAALVIFNDLAHTLKLVPATAENANGVHFAASLTRNASTTRPEDLLTVDMDSVVRPALLELKEAFIKVMFEAQEEALSLQEQYDVLDERVMLKRDEIKTHESRLGKLEQQYATDKEGLVEQLRYHADQSLRTEEGITAVKREMDEQLRVSQRRVANSTAELREVKEKLAQLRAEVASNLLAAFDKLTSHKAHVQESLAALRAHFEQQLNEIQVLATQ